MSLNKLDQIIFHKILRKEMIVLKKCSHKKSIKRDIVKLAHLMEIVRKKGYQIQDQL